MLRDASVASDDCFGILADFKADDGKDNDINRRRRILLIYRVKLAMIENNIAALSDIIDRCTADPNIDALTMTLIFACLNSEGEQGGEAPSSSSALRQLRTMGLKGALVKHLRCMQVGRDKRESTVDAPRARIVVRLFHSLIRDTITYGGSEGAAIERLCDDLLSFLRTVETPDWPQKECARLLVELWNR